MFTFVIYKKISMYLLNEKQIYFGDITAKKLEKVPAGVWLLCYDGERKEFYLEQKENFTLPEKLYGTVVRDAAKYLNTYKHMDKNMSVLLSGMKGTGKSLLARKLAMDVQLPVIQITQAYGGTAFYNFMSSFNQELCFFIDEYEKVYSEKDTQNTLLSIFDGTFSSKFLFILTINEINRMNTYMMNRPGRIRYLKEYKGLDKSTIHDIILDRLDNQKNMDEIKKICTFLGDVSMDMLSALIDECNIYPNESPRELLRELNMSPESSQFTYDIIRKTSGKVFYTGELGNNPLAYNNLNISWWGYTEHFDGKNQLEIRDEIKALTANDSVNDDDERFEQRYDIDWNLADTVVDIDTEGRIMISSIDETIDYYVVFAKKNHYRYTL